VRGINHSALTILRFEDTVHVDESFAEGAGKAALIGHDRLAIFEFMRADTSRRFAFA